MTEEIKRQAAVLLAHEDPDMRRAAAETIAQSHELVPIAVLAAALRDDNKGVRDAASRSLSTIGGPTVALAIVEYLGNENITTRNLAAELLVKLGDTAVPAILPYLDDPSRDVRKFAVDILGLIRNGVPVSRIIPLIDDPDDNVVVSAVESLGNIGAADAVLPLYQAYDKYEYTRSAVAEALGKIGDTGASDFLLLRFNEAVASPSSDPVVLFALIEALGSIGNDRARRVLLPHVRDVKGKVRHALLRTLVQLSERLAQPIPFSPELKPEYIDALSDDDVSIRLSAVKALSGSSDDDVSAAFVRVLGSAPELDALVLPALETREETFRLVVEALGDRSVKTGKASIALLGRLALEFIRKIMRREMTRIDEGLFARAFDGIAARWGTGDEEMRALIVDSLFRLDGDRAVEFLDTIMNDPDPWLRIHVIELIAAISDRRAPEFISRFLQDDDEMVRDVAAETLRAQGFTLDDSTLIERE